MLIFDSKKNTTLILQRHVGKDFKHYELLGITFWSKKNAGLRDSGNSRIEEHYGMPALLLVVRLPLDRSSLKPACIYGVKNHKYLSV